MTLSGVSRKARKLFWLYQSRIVPPPLWHAPTPKQANQIRDIYAQMGTREFKLEELRLIGVSKQSKGMIVKRLNEIGALLKPRRGHYMLNPCYLVQFHVVPEDEDRLRYECWLLKESYGWKFD